MHSGFHLLGCRRSSLYEQPLKECERLFFGRRDPEHEKPLFLATPDREDPVRRGVRNRLFPFVIIPVLDPVFLFPCNDFRLHHALAHIEFPHPLTRALVFAHPLCNDVACACECIRDGSPPLFQDRQRQRLRLRGQFLPVRKSVAASGSSPFSFAIIALVRRFGLKGR